MAASIAYSRLNITDSSSYQVYNLDFHFLAYRRLILFAGTLFYRLDMACNFDCFRLAYTRIAELPCSKRRERKGPESTGEDIQRDEGCSSLK